MAVTRDLVHLTADGDVDAGPGRRGRPCFWPYTQSWRHLTRQVAEELVDPVSILVASPPSAVLTALAESGWESNPREGGVHCLWGAHVPRRMTAHAALGPPEERDHVRLWSFGGATLAAAHHEVRAEGGGHRVTSWDIARERVGAALGRFGVERRNDTAVVTLPLVRGLASDGRIWRFASLKGVMDQ